MIGKQGNIIIAQNITLHEKRLKLKLKYVFSTWKTNNSHIKSVVVAERERHGIGTQERDTREIHRRETRERYTGERHRRETGERHRGKGYRRERER